jgi:glycosyltransferase involved in cell wall biosynthesis
MKVLHVIESLEFGGAEKVVVNLANAMVDHAHVDICCVKRPGELCAALDPRVSVLCLNKGEGNDWRLPGQLAHLVRGGGYDVVHSHAWGVFLEPALARTRSAAWRLVHTVHGDYPAYRPGLASAIKRRVRRFLERRVAQRYDAVVAVSDSICDYVARDLGLRPPQLVTIHNGIGAHPSSVGPRRDGPLTFITVGRLSTVKNQALMLRAFARVASEFPDARLRFVGDGPERPALVSEVERLGLAGRVEFLGFRNDIDALLAEAHVFLMSSHYEGISIAVLEAMRARLPVIASRVGGMPETLADGRCGILFDDGDAEAMADAMGRLARARDTREAMGEAAQQRQREEFSLAATIAKYDALYRAGIPD